MNYSAGIIRAKEKTENTVVFRDADDQDGNAPDYICQSYRDQIEDVKLVRAVYGGTKTMREKGEKFLPKHPMEQQQRYNARLGQAIAYNALSKTVAGLVGMVFRRDPVYKGLPPALEEHAQNIDMRGSALPIFLRRVGEAAVLDGHTWLHIESPMVDPAAVRNRAEERALGVRPYWVHITKERAHNWRYEMRNGAPVLTLFAYREGGTEPDGEFGERQVERIRVLREIAVGVIQGELWEWVEERETGKKRWERIQVYPVGTSVVPVVAVYAERAEMFESDPPLRDLAYEQIEHYRVRSDRQKSLTFSSIAVPYLFGERVFDAEGNAKVSWGPDGMLLLQDPTAKTGMIESSGAGLDATKEELQEIEARMASLGLQMLMRKPGTQPGTATEKLLNKAEDDAALVVFAKLLEDAANNALVLHGEYMGVTEPGEIKVNRDFHDQLMDPALLRELNAMVATGTLSVETMWDLLIEGELLTEGFDPELERARLASGLDTRLARMEAALFDGSDEDAE